MAITSDTDVAGATPGDASARATARGKCPAAFANAGYIHRVPRTESDDTNELIRELLDGNADAWRRLVERYSGFLLSVTSRTFSSYGAAPEPQDCEDAVADVWRNLIENQHRVLRDCLTRGNLLPTLQVLARHRAVDILRKRRPTQQLPDDSGLAPAVSKESQDQSGLDTEALAAALDELTPRERVLVNLFFLQGKKYREIAAITGIPQNSIGPTLGRAVARLRDAMNG